MIFAHIHDKHHAREHILKPIINNIFSSAGIVVF